MLWKDISEGISAFFEDLKEHDTGDNVVMYLFSEFGRRVHDNGSGHRPRRGGRYVRHRRPGQGRSLREMPSAAAEDLEQGDLVPNYDFRGGYATLLEDWFGLDANPIVNGNFEKLDWLKK